ncbi:hypothetical protein [Psychrobacter sp. N25K4-3-2]|uniref:hypothetical protein n=1 Tax=Psychrobacter sp. N25K4-3-2 TaxID=2785026 RepID=UPI001D10B228|nr:hypothetical protein [Psychrobacter sp. N25K4-3-2]
MSKSRHYQCSLAAVMLIAAMSTHAAPTVTNTSVNTGTTDPLAEQAATAPVTTPNSSLDINNTLAAQLQPSNKALNTANQELLSRNAQLQRQVNDLQTQANVLVYESKGQLFLYGAFTVLISLLVGIFVSWLVFVRRERW